MTAFALALAIATSPAVQTAAPPELYRFVLIQAAPGRLLDLIDLYKKRLPFIAAGGDEMPYIVRHSQGDRWDLLVIYPSGSFTSYYSADRVRRREAAAAASGVTGAQFAKQFYDLVAWHEDVYVEGPPLPVFRSYVKDLGLLHLEMFQALAGKRDQLIEERKMESAFNKARSRPEALLFTHEQGAAWDVITLDGFRNWRHYAESETIPVELNESAAKGAGFGSFDAISPYLRSLIALHHDTLGTPVILPGGGAGMDASLPPSPPQQAPVRVGGNIRMPRRIQDATPVVPAVAQQAGIRGVVILEIIIGTDGAVTDATILRSIPLLDQAALDTVRKWRYEPTLLNGTPVRVILTATVNFP